MLGKIVLTGKITLIEYKGERLYLSWELGKGFQLGDDVTFLEIIDDTPLRRAEQIVNLPTFREDFQKHELMVNHPEDLTHLKTFTLDPDGSKDLDDAISVDEDYVYVHITFFELDSSTRKRAQQQQFSIYMPEKTHHLLPLPWATKKYSLIKDKIRLTWTVQFDHQMNFKHIYLAYIQSQHELSYNQEDPVFEQALAIYQKYGSPSLPVPSYNYCIQKDKLISIDPIQTNPQKEMIQYFMVQTNRAVAEYLSEKGVLFPRRAQDPPTKDIQTSEYSDDIAAYLQVRKSPVAYYTVLEKKHTQLNLPTYTHFTSPIRRYPDQVVSQILLGVKFTREELVEICTQANIQERRIEAKNEEYLQLKIDEYLKEHPIHTGTVTYVSSWGIHVLMVQLRRTIQLHVSKLRSGYATQKFKRGDKIQLEYVEEWRVV